MKRILIDTRIWVLVLKLPFMPVTDTDFETAKKAKDWIVKEFVDSNKILFSSQLISEIFHVLTRRGRKLPSKQAELLLLEILEKNFVFFKPVAKDTLREAIKISSGSGIHIWDYLVVLPFQGEVDIIFTMDPHFQDDSFRKIARIDNPLGIWRSEGKTS